MEFSALNRQFTGIKRHRAIARLIGTQRYGSR